MASRNDSRSFIPVPTAELVRLLAEAPELPAGEGAAFRAVAAPLGEALHRGLRKRLEGLLAAYAPFDPDSDGANLYTASAAERQRGFNALMLDLNWMLGRAQFRHLGREELEPFLDEVSDFCPRMSVDFSVFDHLSVFVRGDAMQTRTLRNWKTLFLSREEEVPVFRRLVLVLKLRPGPRLAAGVSAEHVYLKLFKDIPRAGIGMLMPGAKVRINLFDRGKIGAGLLSGLGTMAWRLLGNLGEFLHNFENALFGVFAGVLGYGFKSYSDWQTTRQAYQLNLTESLYFQNLDSNAGVLARLLDEADQQQTRTALLAYYCLWRYHAGGARPDELADSMGLFLDRYVGLPAICEPGEAAGRLRELGLAEEADGLLRAVPPARACEALGAKGNAARDESS